MKRFAAILPIAFCMAFCFACGKETADKDGGAITFPVYPGARSLPELTELFKRGSAVNSPGHPVPPQMIYDTEASLEDVAAFYSKENGFGKVAPDSSGNMSSVAPPAYYLSGDMHNDTMGLKPTLDKLNMKVDLTKAVGTYRGAHINATSTRPRVSLSRPYFDLVHGQVVDRTLIILVQE